MTWRGVSICCNCCFLNRENAPFAAVSRSGYRFALTVTGSCCTREANMVNANAVTALAAGLLPVLTAGNGQTILPAITVHGLIKRNTGTQLWPLNFLVSPGWQRLLLEKCCPCCPLAMICWYLCRFIGQGSGNGATIKVSCWPRN